MIAQEVGLTELLPSPHYARAPITEAVIELRVANPATVKQQEKVVKRLKKLYPRSEAMQAFSVNVDTTGGTLSVSQSPQGFRLTNDDQTGVVLIQPNGVTTSRLPPYPGWEALRESAQIVWDHWKRSTPRQPVNRIGVRYVNRIDVPLDESPTIDLKDYLQFYPQNPCLSGGYMIGHIIQVTRPTIMPHWTYSITSTIKPPPLLKHFSVLLDIDVFRKNDIPSKEEQLWNVIDEARNIKNDIFQRCITDKTRELIS